MRASWPGTCTKSTAGASSHSVLPDFATAKKLRTRSKRPSSTCSVRFSAASSPSSSSLGCSRSDSTSVARQSGPSGRINATTWEVEDMDELAAPSANDYEGPEQLDAL